MAKKIEKVELDHKSMSDDECAGIKLQRQTDKDIREIRTLISDITGNIGSIVANSTSNKEQMVLITASYKDLAESNELTHYKLFGRTEQLKISLAKCETTVHDHKEGEEKDAKAARHRHIILVSVVAVCCSVITALLFAMGSGLISKFFTG